MVGRKDLSEDLTVEQTHTMCVYVGRVSQTKGTANAKAMKSAKRFLYPSLAGDSLGCSSVHNGREVGKEGLEVIGYQVM